MSNSVNQTDRYFPVYYTGYENDGTTVINSDIPQYGVVATVELASSIETETGQQLQKVTRPSTANLVRARHYVVAKNDNLANVNAAHPDGTANRRKGGIVWVFNPHHPANQEVLALVASNVLKGESLVPTNQSWSFSDAGTVDATIVNRAIKAVAREDYVAATTPQKVSLVSV